MSQDDPFATSADGDRTVIRPIPGGRRPPGQAADTPPPQQAPPSAAGATPWLRDSPVAGDHNILVQCAAPLLALAGQLRRSISHPDPAGLRNHLIDEVRRFEACARARSIDDATVLPARYVLCALIDEAILGTPWGSESVWAERGLLVTFHNETWGGEKFYLLLDRLITDPSANLHMLELLYLCLTLGFQGRYSDREGGREQLAAVHEQLFQVIRQQRDDPQRELSIHWQGVREQRDPLTHFVPLWVLSAVAGALLLALFTGFLFALNQDSDPVFLSLGALDKALPDYTQPQREEFVAPPEPVPLPEPGAPPPLTLRILLADDIAADRMEIEDRDVGQTVILNGDGLFRSGQSQIRKEYGPRLVRIGEALRQLPGRVLVTGHTDSVPIKTLRFPSNWHLSQERAASVAAQLATITGDPERFKIEGLGETQPRISANPKDARNRRVEITLMAP